MYEYEEEYRKDINDILNSDLSEETKDDLLVELYINGKYNNKKYKPIWYIDDLIKSIVIKYSKKHCLKQLNAYIGLQDFSYLKELNK